MKKIRVFVLGLLALALSACATFDSRNDPAPLKAFAVFSDYTAIAATAALYVNSQFPDPNIKARIKQADAKAWPAVGVMMTVAGGEMPDFCDSPGLAPVDTALLVSACNQDLPAVVRQTRLLVALLASVIKETAQ